MYFFEQFGSGHSSSTGEDGGLEDADAEVEDGAGVGPRLFFDGASSSGALGLRLLGVASGRGGTNGVGDDGPRRPLAPPLLLLRNLLCTEERVSVKLLKSFAGDDPVAPRPRFPLPFGVLASRSLVGESQNLGGAQSCLVQSNRVPT